MKAGVLRETWPGETRVAVVPGVLPALAKAGIEVLVESGAGDAAGFPDAEYADRGAAVVSRDQVLAEASLLFSVRSFSGGQDADATSRLGPRHVVIGFLDPLQRPEGARTLAGRGLTSFALELVPRISRAQSMDTLSSTATMVGYKAVLLAADTLPRMMPMMMTAAGTVAPARVFVIGAGVAGLTAIATARRLGAVVEAYDVRPAVKEQVHSLGAKFVELPLETATAEDEGGYAAAQDKTFYRRQRELLAKVVADSDVVISAAAVPGKRAPVLVTGEMLRGMRPGSVVVDLASEQGGNCEASEPREGRRQARSQGAGAAEPRDHHPPPREPAVRKERGELRRQHGEEGRASARRGRRDRPRQHAEPRRGGRPPARARGARARPAFLRMGGPAPHPPCPPLASPE